MRRNMGRLGLIEIWPRGKWRLRMRSGRVEGLCGVYGGWRWRVWWLIGCDFILSFDGWFFFCRGVSVDCVVHY